MGTSLYRMFGFWRFQIIAVSVVFWLVAIAMLAADAAGAKGAPPWPFAIFWSAACAWATLNFLLRVAYELRLENGVLTWQAPLRSGEVPLSEIRELRPMISCRNAEVIKLEHGGGIIV
jgi:hypothetical protein